MNHAKRRPRGFVEAAVVALVALAGARAASAQHVTAAMAATMGMQGPEAGGCEDRARQAAKQLDVLNADRARLRGTNNETEERAAVDALRVGLADVKNRLEACRAGATSPVRDGSAAPPATPPAATPHTPVTPAAGATPALPATDHAAMGHAAPAGAAAVPATVRQISGPAEAALQSFQDALQVGNREVALQWLAPQATVTEAGVTDQSRDAYASGHMSVDMAFLKNAKVVLLDRQVHPGADSTHIVSTSRLIGRAGETAVDVTVTERALLTRTPQGWRIVSLEWSLDPMMTYSGTEER